MKRFIARPGQKVTIEIGSKSKVQSPKSKIRIPKGLLTSRRADDYLPRRIKPGGIKFYDLGMILIDGEYQDIDSQLIKPWTNMSGSGLPFPAPLDDSDYDGRDALVLANFETAAQIKPDYTGHISGFMTFDDSFAEMSDASPVWSSKGLKLTSTQLASEYVEITFGPSGNFFDSIILKGEGANKITEVYDYDGDAVEFNLQKNDKIYLVPVYCRSLLVESFPDHMGFFNFVQQLNYFWQFFPRVPILNGTAPAAIDGKTLPNARVMRSTQTTFGGAYTNSEQPASAFESDSTGSLVHELPADATREGFLVAIIRQGGNTFYVWKSE